MTTADQHQTQDAQTVADKMKAAQDDMHAGAKLLVYDALQVIAARGSEPPSELAARAWQYAQRSDEELEEEMHGRIAGTPTQTSSPDIGPSHTVSIESITVRNWRSFYGEHTIECSATPDRPLTLIFGPNGAGKTSLLNAFTWCLFGTFTAGFREPEQLVNHQAQSDGDTAMVKVKLKHDGNVIEVTRHDGGQAAIVTIAGVSKTETDLHRLFPPALKDMFFFPAETFSNAEILEGGAADGVVGKNLLPVRDSILKLLSGEHYEQCSKGLSEAQRQSNLKVTGSSDKKAEKAQQEHLVALAECAELQDQLDALPGQIETARVEAEHAREAAAKVSQEAIEAYEAAKTALEGKLSRANQLVYATNLLCHDIVNAGPAVLVNSLLHAGEQRLDEAEHLGLIPPLIDPRILDRSVEAHRCMICEEEFRDSTAERFEALKNKAASGVTSRVALDARSALLHYRKRSDDKLNDLRSRAKQLAQDLTESYEGGIQATTVADDATLQHLVSFAQTTIDSVISLRDHLQTRLTEHTASDVDTKNDSALLDSWRNKQNKHDALIRRAETLPDLLAAAEERKDATHKAWMAVASLTDENGRKARAVDLLGSAAHYFRTVHQAMRDAVRTDVEREINRFYERMVDKAYRVEVDDMFRLKVVNEDLGLAVGISQSESVLLLLSFIAAVSRLAPRYEQLRSARNAVKFEKLGLIDDTMKSGLPVVVDAPISALDSRYELTTINAIPEISHQALVFVSKKAIAQWTEVDDSIGRGYVMCLRGNRQVDDWIEWRDTKHQYTVHDETTTGRTTIEEI